MGSFKTNAIEISAFQCCVIHTAVYLLSWFCYCVCPYCHTYKVIVVFNPNSGSAKRIATKQR